VRRAPVRGKPALGEEIKMEHDLSKDGGADARALAALALSAALLERLTDVEIRAIIGSALTRLPKAGFHADKARRIIYGMTFSKGTTVTPRLNIRLGGVYHLRKRELHLVSVG